MPKRHTPLPYGLHPSAYGGILRNRAKGRGARTLSVRYSMHLVLRSVLARGAWSFVRPQIKTMINGILARHAAATGIELLAVGNAGNKAYSPATFGTKALLAALFLTIAMSLA
jgi:hypothetical protein